MNIMFDFISQLSVVTIRLLRLSVVTSMGARRHGQGGAHAPPWKIPDVFKNMLMLQS